ncbi:MAG: cation diffusion facilitator family transporter [Candidatus Thorarchaeota archaeon]
MDYRVKFGILALLIIIIQSAIKLLGVLLTGSLSFLSETVDTLLDIIFVSLTIYSIQLSLKPPDYQHMYGHTKVDSIGAMVQGIILINIYIYIIIRAIQVIFENSSRIINPDIGLQLLIVSFIINLFFSRFLIWEGKKRNSLSLKMQGLNLFQDSLRAIFVLLNFIFALFFEIEYLDPYFSVALSIFIIYGAIRLLIEGIGNLIDVNPISVLILEEMKQNIFNLDHVNGVEELKVRATGNILFLEVHLSVEDHISIIHANEVTKAIRAMTKKYIPFYNVESIVEMNPLSGEKSPGEKIINIIHSMKSEFPKILNFRNVNVFRVEDKTFLSLSLIFEETLSLEQAHEICNNFESELKRQSPLISRIITHIESGPAIKLFSSDQIVCESIAPEKMHEIQSQIEEVLREEPQVKGFHGLECWTAMDLCILELHIFFDGSLNISFVHDLITNLEHKVRDKLRIENLNEIIFHSEPIEGIKKGIIF